jgi:hypothetical protein
MFKELLMEEETKYPNVKLTGFSDSIDMPKSVDFGRIFKANIWGNGLDEINNLTDCEVCSKNKYVVITSDRGEDFHMVIEPASGNTIKGSKKFNVYNSEYGEPVKYKNLSTAGVIKLVKQLFANIGGQIERYWYAN